ncbi:hypothetical protein BAE44_0000626 [Dichanthelium oligosanthes]|uniref:Uncharacterized protein n=1 Tax=Dichanthelium oligosanthes TaxID=888268 RepID=A0A1E5WLQ8_9POAL|nr:hypothetical protein BAE44_0000626 [Dichanthelium oligosanthes]
MRGQLHLVSILQGEGINLVVLSRMSWLWSRNVVLFYRQMSISLHLFFLPKGLKERCL